MEFSYLFDFFLLFILKNARNVWLTEKRGELVFGDNDAQRTAKWSHSNGFKRKH